jgi:hypothetical protein
MGPASNDKDSYSLAIMSVGAALVVLFAGAAVIAAVGHQVPKELWGAASTLSGALVGSSSRPRRPRPTPPGPRPSRPRRSRTAQQ